MLLEQTDVANHEDDDVVVKVTVQLALEGWVVLELVPDQMEGDLTLVLRELECRRSREHEKLPPVLGSDNVGFLVVHHVDRLTQLVVHNALLSLFSYDLDFLWR